MRNSVATPPIALPFALLGAAAGYAGSTLLANPLLQVLPADRRALATCVAALAGAVVGAFLRRRLAQGVSVWSTSSSWGVLLALPLLGGGAASGALLGAVIYRSAGGGHGGSIVGLVAAMITFPLHAVVLRMALRRSRARFGSCVAASDRRLAWVALSACIAATTTLTVADWPASADGAAPAPALAAVVAGLAALTTAFALVCQVRLLERVRHLCRNAIVEVDPAALRAAETVDLGLGDSTWTRRGLSGTPYRGRSDPGVSILGDPRLAQPAIAGGVVANAASVLVCCVALAAHAVARRPEALAVYRELRCADDDAAACGGAGAQHARGEAWGSTHERAEWLLFRGCVLGDDASCAGHAMLLAEEDLERPGFQPEDAVLASACRAGNTRSCGQHADLVLAGPLSDGHASLRPVASILHLACQQRDETACAAVQVLRTLPEGGFPVREVAWCLRGFAGDCDLAAWLTEPSASRSLRSHPDLALHELGCTQGRAWSCHLAAWKWAATGRRFDDAGAVDREAHAVGLHTRACVLGAAPSCCEGAWIRAHGAAANRDLAKARALFDRASCMLEQELGACAVLRDEPAIASPSHTVESLRTVIRGIEWPVSSVDAKVEESCRPPRPGIQRQSEDLGVNWQ